MKTARLRAKVKDYLRNGPKSTAEILEYVNTTSRHGTTTQQLGNILSKDKDIIKIGFVRRMGSRYGSYNICEWDLTEMVSEEQLEKVKELRETEQLALR